MDKRLHEALRMLRTIRQRYETGRRRSDSDFVRSYTVHVALSKADMLWIDATIAALEKAATLRSG